MSVKCFRWLWIARRRSSSCSKICRDIAMTWNTLWGMFVDFKRNLLKDFKASIIPSFIVLSNPSKVQTKRSRSFLSWRRTQYSCGNSWNLRKLDAANATSVRVRSTNDCPLTSPSICPICPIYPESCVRRRIASSTWCPRLQRGIRRTETARRCNDHTRHCTDIICIWLESP